MQDKYIRKAELVRVVDGDTVELDIDLGFSINIREKVRVLGVDCPEMRGESKAAGVEAKLFTLAWFEYREGQQLFCRTTKDKQDSFGRFLAEITTADGIQSLGVDLLAAGHAVPFKLDNVTK